MIHYVYVCDLTAVASDSNTQSSLDRHSIEFLDRVADGGRVRVTVGSRKYPTADAVDGLRRNQDRLVIQIEGTSLAEWFSATIGGAA